MDQLINTKIFSFRSTLQNYLKRHEGKDVNKGNVSKSNPFERGEISARPVVHSVS